MASMHHVQSMNQSMFKKNKKDLGYGSEFGAFVLICCLLFLATLYFSIPLSSRLSWSFHIFAV